MLQVTQSPTTQSNKHTIGSKYGRKQLGAKMIGNSSDGQCHKCRSRVQQTAVESSEIKQMDQMGAGSLLQSWLQQKELQL